MIFRIKPSMFLILLLEKDGEIPKTASYLSKKTDTTYGHTINIIDIYIKEGMITKEKFGRIRVLSLTTKGCFIAEKMKTIMELLKDEGKSNDEGLCEPDSACKSKEYGEVKEKIREVGGG